MLDRLTVKIFADGADIDDIRRLRDDPRIAGFTSNPTLMNKSGIKSYKAFGLEAASLAGEKPVSLAVVSDDLPAMEEEALEISSWGDHVNVKIPVMNTQGESCVDLVRRLSARGVFVNVTAIFSHTQLETMVAALTPGSRAILSVFAGRVADAGVDPEEHMRRAVEIVRPNTTAQLLWASPREVYNVVQADRVGCDIVTLTGDLMSKLSCLGKDMHEYSLETVRMFRESAQKAGYSVKE